MWILWRLSAPQNYPALCGAFEDTLDWKCKYKESGLVVGFLEAPVSPSPRVWCGSKIWLMPSSLLPSKLHESEATADSNMAPRRGWILENLVPKIPPKGIMSSSTFCCFITGVFLNQSIQQILVRKKKNAKAQNMKTIIYMKLYFYKFVIQNNYSHCFSVWKWEKAVLPVI